MGDSGHMYSDSVFRSCQTDRSELDVNTLETKISSVGLLGVFSTVEFRDSGEGSVCNSRGFLTL